MDIFLKIITIGLTAFVAIRCLYFIGNYIIEPAFIMIFDRPVYVHLYLFPKKLGAQQIVVLENKFRFYRNLSDRRKVYFHHRVASFINRYQFAGREGLIVSDEMRVSIAATSVMLTFGMRKYLYDVFSAIIIYPDIFPSRKDDNFHKGEFNPAARVVVFSWKHFVEGLEHDGDNLNLGLHEFAHALHFNSLRKRNPGVTAVIYKDGFNDIMKYLGKEENRQQLIAAGYFRVYAYTNQYEFVAVILEYFFETPDKFRQKLPELYKIVKRMINFRE